MTVTIQIKLCPTQDQEQLLLLTMKEYISFINNIVDYALGQGHLPVFTTKTVQAALPAAVKNQAIRDAKNIYRKAVKTGIQPELKLLQCIWNNQNYHVKDGLVEIPVLLNNRSTRLKIKAKTTQDILDRLNTGKLGTLRITRKNNKLIAQISLEVPEAPLLTNTKVMGVDLGIKCPAVCRTSDNKTAFFGNGRQMKFKRRCYKKRRKKLGKAKKLSIIRKLQNKENRWMADVDHKISRQVVEFAKKNQVSVIRLEELTGIRTSRKRCKNEFGLHTWSFYRLSKFIEYKAALAGIAVEYVNAAYTSQECPVCGARHKTKTRKYKCKCGYRGHRDVVGAINIAKRAPSQSGHRTVAQGSNMTCLATG